MTVVIATVVPNVPHGGRRTSVLGLRPVGETVALLKERNPGADIRETDLANLIYRNGKIKGSTLLVSGRRLIPDGIIPVIEEKLRALGRLPAEPQAVAQ